MFLNIDNYEKGRVFAIDDKNEKLTWKKLNEIASSIEIEEKSVVFCLCQNDIESLSIYLTSQLNGFIPLLIDGNIDDEMLNDLIEAYKPQYIWKKLSDKSIIQGKTIFELNKYHILKTEYNQYCVNEELSLLLTTSGSTGSPKLVRHTMENLEENAENVSLGFNWDEEEVGIISIPMYYSMGLNVINSHIISGAKIVLTNYTVINKQFWDIMKEQSVTNFTGVPFNYELMDKLRIERFDIPSLKTLAVGGGKLSDRLFRKYVKYAEDNNIRFFSTYGTTETTARISYLPPEISSMKIGSIGKPFPNGRMYLIDDNNNEITTSNCEGELIFEGQNVTMGYAENKEDLRLGDIWKGKYSTQDIAIRDEDGYFYIVGRKSRFIKIAGHRISLDQLENIIKNHVGIECACSGIDDNLTVYITDNCSKSEIEEVITKRISLHKAFFNVVQINNIPKNSFGKINYKKLEKMN